MILSGGKRLGGGWIALIVILSIGAVIGTILGIYYGEKKSIEDKLGGQDCQKDSDCPTQQKCGPGGICIRSCAVCPSGYCGDDKCGGTCPCGSGQTCVNGTCTASPAKVGVVTAKNPMLATVGVGCDGKVVNPSIPCVARRASSASRACTNCTSSEECVNNQCQPICIPKCPLGACSGNAQAGAPDGCGGTCCKCGSGFDCVNGQCVTPGTCSPSCGTGEVCSNGTCVPDTSNCGGQTCTASEKCVNNQCVPDCSPPCTGNETCVNGTCKCTPQCAANSCGSDGCGGTCPCGSGQTCNSSGTCVSCTPNCPATGCGGSNGCGGTCGCGAGKVCQNGSCVTDSSPWVGWATTTQYGSGENCWGNDHDPTLYLPTINNEAANRMGAAVPWRNICQNFGTKQNQIQQTVDSGNGKITDKVCYLIQPINKYPDQISGTTDPLYVNSANLCDPTKGPCTDINDDSIVAVDGNGQPYPSYLVPIFEGCGGDGNPASGTGADVINDCIESSGNDIHGITCQWGLFTGPLCAGAKVLYNDGNWGWNDTLQQDFEKYSAVLAITPETDYGRQITEAVAKAGLPTNHTNFCSGKNMHFDMAITTPYWENRPKGNIAYTTADSNIMVRYKPVPCNYGGNFDMNLPDSPDQFCPENTYVTTSPSTCTTGVLMPGDPEWPNSSSVTTYACCKSGGSGGKCTGGEFYQAPGDKCPCPAGQCFYNFTNPLDNSPGKCGACSAAAAACAVGTQC